MVNKYAEKWLDEIDLELNETNTSINKLIETVTHFRFRHSFLVKYHHKDLEFKEEILFYQNDIDQMISELDQLKANSIKLGKLKAHLAYYISLQDQPTALQDQPTVEEK